MSDKEENEESDNDEVELPDEFFDDSEVVYSLYWDSGDPGSGADSETVHYWKGRYYTLTSDRTGGPYDSLEDALRDDGPLMVTPCTESIDCESLSSEAIAAMLWTGDEPLAFKINGEQWKYEKGAGFQKAKPKRTRPKERRG